jgi:epoxyqueuosine reductase
MSSSDLNLAALLKHRAQDLGLDPVGIAAASRLETFDLFSNWLRRGYQGEMGYLPGRKEAYEHPSGVLKSVRSVIMGALSHTPSSAPNATSRERAEGRIAAYAQGTVDYHDVLREKLRELAALLHEHRPGCQTRVTVDTAPLLERDLARTSGLGWFGKNTMLLNKRIGSYFFLGAVLTDVALPADAPHQTAHCGTCTRCLEACPTDAFVEPYVLDARRCISYLTIELRDRPVPVEFREQMGDWLFGCDVCQEVCPWNRKAPVSPVPEFVPREDLAAADAARFLLMNEEEFQREYGATPLSRPGRTGMARNAAIVLGNTHDPRWLPSLRQALEDPSPLVREAAAWAIETITGREPSPRSSEGAARGARNPTDHVHQDHGSSRMRRMGTD